MKNLILLILVIIICNFIEVKPDADFLDTALRVMVLIEKVELLFGKKPEERSLGILRPHLVIALHGYLRYPCKAITH